MVSRSSGTVSSALATASTGIGNRACASVEGWIGTSRAEPV